VGGGCIQIDATAEEQVTNYLRRRRSTPLDQLFRREGAATLALITCGGRYDRGLGYRDNVIVTAAPERL
jgi:hypothetical protein